jgi:GH24 family phage-related lysozyme (muramidase)
MAIGHMKTSQNGIDLIKSFEGFRSQAYRPVITEKYLTIGYGHYGPDVRMGQTITKEQAEALLRKDVEKFEKNVNKWDYTYDFNQNEFDALVSFAYNIGSIDQLTAQGKRSRQEIADKMLLYVHGAGGIKLQGLVKRRQLERELFMKGKTELKKLTIPEPTLRIRCKSERVKQLQHAINVLFNDTLAEDGSFGKLTKGGVMRAQDRLGISIDGIYGPQTNRAFINEACRLGYEVIFP